MTVVQKSNPATELNLAQTTASIANCKTSAQEALSKTSVPEKVKNLHFDAAKDCFELKMKIPKSANPDYKGQCKRISLGTNNLEEAKRRLPAARERALAEIATKDAEQPKGSKKLASLESNEYKTEHHLLEAHVPAITHNFKAIRLSQDSARRANCSEEDFEDYTSTVAKELQAAKMDIARAQFDKYDAMAREMLHIEKLVCPPSNVFDEFVKSIAFAHRDVLIEIQDRLNGSSSKPDPIRFPARSLPTLRTAFDEWAKKQTNPKTVLTFCGHVAKFESILNRLPIAAIKREHVQMFAEALSKEGLSKATIQNHTGNLATLVNDFCNSIKNSNEKSALKLLKMGEYQTLFGNPFHKPDLREIADKKKHEMRRPFETAEAQTVIDSLAPMLDRSNTVAVEDRDFAMFVMFGFFTGARLEELAQLRTRDLVYERNNPFLRITNQHEDNVLKTESSERLVPVHKELIAVGILEFFNKKSALSDDSNALLFASIASNRADNRKGDAIGKRFARHLDKLGLTDPRLCFHSCRYNFKQTMTKSGVDPKARDACLGHWESASSDVYFRDASGNFSILALQKAMTETVFEYHAPCLAKH